MAAERRQKILAHYEKSEKDLAEDVKLIREWLKTQPHLPETPTISMIEFFIVNNKFSLEKAKKKLDTYYSIRTLLPDIYGISNPKSPQMKAGAKTHYTFVLPKLLDDKYQVCLFKETSYIPSNFDVNWWIASSLVNATELVLNESFALGVIIIYDHQHLKMDHVLRITPMHVKRTVNILEKVLSSRVKEFHVINHPPFFDLVLKLFKPLMKPKLYERLKLHPSLESLGKSIPLDILPKDYGGTEKSIEELQELWNEKLSKYQDRFDKLDTLEVNEHLRPTPMDDIESFGIPGTFKKLSVD